MSTFMTGSNVNPTCNEDLSRASRTTTRRCRASASAASSCRVRTSTTSRRGRAIRTRTTRSGRTSTWPRSVARCRSTAQGNLGNAAQGQLRHPGWQNWDFTLARRIPVNIGRGGSIRVQAQFYNVFDLVQFQRLAASYTFAAPPLPTLGEHEHDHRPVRRGHQPVQLRDHDPHGLLSPTHTPGARELCGHPVPLWEVRRQKLEGRRQTIISDFCLLPF